MIILNIYVYIINILIIIILLIRGLFFFVLVLIISVYLDIIEKLRGGVLLSVDNLIKNSIFIIVFLLVIIDLFMDFKIGVLFVFKVFV